MAMMTMSMFYDSMAMFGPNSCMDSSSSDPDYVPTPNESGGDQEMSEAAIPPRPKRPHHEMMGRDLDDDTHHYHYLDELEEDDNGSDDDYDDEGEAFDDEKKDPTYVPGMD